MRIGIDIGGTKIVAGVIDDKGDVICTERIATETCKGYEGVRDDIVNLIRAVLQRASVDKKDVEQIGIAVAGQIERRTGKVLFSPNMNWRNVPLGSDIENAFGLRTIIENDVNAAAYGEWKFAMGGAPESLLGIFVGTGIGGGLIIDRKLYRGFAGVGAEAGHIILNPDGYRCNCGNRGCFEAYCGGAYVVGRVKDAIDKGWQGKIWDIIDGRFENLHTGTIEKAYELGDEVCRGLWQEVIEYMGAGLASLVNLLNPEVLVLGGGVINSTHSLLGQAREVLEKRAMAASLASLHIVKAKLGEEAALLGVSYIDEE